MTNFVRCIYRFSKKNWTKKNCIFFGNQQGNQKKTAWKRRNAVVGSKIMIFFLFTVKLWLIQATEDIDTQYENFEFFSKKCEFFVPKKMVLMKQNLVNNNRTNGKNLPPINKDRIRFRGVCTQNEFLKFCRTPNCIIKHSNVLLLQN